MGLYSLILSIVLSKYLVFSKPHQYTVVLNLLVALQIRWLGKHTIIFNQDARLDDN